MLESVRSDRVRSFVAIGLLASISVFAAPACVGAPEDFEGEEDTAELDEAVVVNDNTYRIQGVQSGKCVDVARASNENGANVQQWDCGNGANQQWQLRHLGNDVFQVQAKHSGKCLDVAGVSRENGGNVHQWSCHGRGNQRWRVQSAGNGEFRLVAEHSGKCLDVAALSRSNGGNLQQWGCGSGANQRFRLLPVSGGGGGDDPGGGTTPGSNPLAGRTFFVDPDSQAAQRERQLRSAGNVAEADLLRKISGQAQGVWIGEWSGDVASAVSREVSRAGGRTPLLVAYNIYQRDCGNHSAGGASSPDAYRRWIDGFASGLGSSRAIVILEPDALALSCNSGNLELLRYAVNALKRQGNTAVYIDAGIARWLSASDAASRLRTAGIERADGFALNVSNYIATGETATFGRAVSGALGGRVGFVIDTSRNGRGATSNSEWCNPPGRGLGQRPTTNTGDARIHALLWVKRPGESDGACNGGPGAGQWFHSYALELARNAVF